MIVAFFESINYKRVEEHYWPQDRIVQGNHSRSFQGLLNGQYYQLLHHPQGKLAHSVIGKFFDVTVGIHD